MLTEIQKLAFHIQHQSFFFLPSLPITWNPHNCVYLAAKHPLRAWIAFYLAIADILLLTFASFYVPIFGFFIFKKPNLSLENAVMILAAGMALLGSLACVIIFWKNHHVRCHINNLLLFQQKLELSKDYFQNLH